MNRDQSPKRRNGNKIFYATATFYFLIGFCISQKCWMNHGIRTEDRRFQECMFYYIKQFSKIINVWTYKSDISA